MEFIVYWKCKITKFMDDLKKYINSLRHDFTLKHLDESIIEKEPFSQFEAWLKEAMQAEIPDPNAFILSTASAQGKPSGRVLLLRDYSSSGFVFYTNYNSRKGRDIESNPFASITFFWQQLERQVRIEGKLQKLAPEKSNEYFNSRPRESRIGAWTSTQSERIENRKVLDDLNQKYTQKFQNKEIPRPKHWGGYQLIPDNIEFWQGRPGRLHDRLVYNLENGSWRISRLAP